MTDGPPAPDVRWRVLTPTSIPGAVAALGLEGPSSAAIDEAVHRLGLGPVPTGRVVLRSLGGHDLALLARWSDTCLHLMPHGGVAVVRQTVAWLCGAGIPRAAGPAATYPEARDRIEALMLHAVSCAQSPLAIDLLLDQPRRWRSAPPNSPTAPAALDRLISPAFVIAIGPPNVGKSTLVNALAGRSVSVVADEPGTTRDHVGVTLDLGGLVVRYADTPGFRAPSDPIEHQARSLTMNLVSQADLILLMGDASHQPPDLDNPTNSLQPIRVALRSDLGGARWPHDLSVSSVTGQGIPALVSTIRDRLVPPAAIADPHPWLFWKNDRMESGGLDP